MCRKSESLKQINIMCTECITKNIEMSIIVCHVEISTLFKLAHQKTKSTLSDVNGSGTSIKIKWYKRITIVNNIGNKSESSISNKNCGEETYHGEKYTLFKISGSL